MGNVYFNYTDEYLVVSETDFDGKEYIDSINYVDNIITRGAFNETLLVYGLGLKKTSKKISYNVNLTYLISKQRKPFEDYHQLSWDGFSVLKDKPDSTKFQINNGDTTYNIQYNLDEKFSQFVLESGIAINSPFGYDRVTLGLNTYLTIYKGKVFLPLSPSVAYKINKRLWAYLTFVRKGNYYW